MSRVYEALLRAEPQLEAPKLDESPGDAGADENNVKPEFRYQSGAGGIPALSKRRANGWKNGDECSVDQIPAPLREELIKLVQRVFVFPKSHAPAAVVFSSVEGNGASDICFYAAQLLAAQASASVCLVCTNLPAFDHTPKEAIECRGLAGAMMSSDPIIEFVVSTKSSNLWFMPPGSSNVTHTHLFPSDQLRSRMIELKQEFDYVLIDAPPVSCSANAIVLGQMADGVILVVEANSTRHEAARIAKETFEAAKVKLFGAILNNHTFPTHEPVHRKS